MDRLCAAAPPTDAPRHTLGSILRQFLPALQSTLGLGARPRRLLSRLAACRTGELGASIFQCPHCHKEHWTARSCGDRHCPRCLASKSRQWLEQQQRSLLPVPYYHCVFTLPCELNALLLLNPARLYPLFFVLHERLGCLAAPAQVTLTEKSILLAEPPSVLSPVDSGPTPILPHTPNRPSTLRCPPRAIA
jgi:hypothetical protein